MAKITVLGSGGLGISLAVMADNFGHEVTVWSAFAEEIENIRRDGEHKKLLPGVKVKESINLITDISLIGNCDIIIFAIPSAFVRKVAKLAAPYVPKNAVIVNVGKGLEDKTFKRLSEVLEEEIAGNPVVALSGPSHAEEVAIGMPTTIVASSKSMEHANYVQEELSNKTLRIYCNDDIIGCELGGALKNIIALCAGICDGMGYGDNTKAALMTRGITEIARLGTKLGGLRETFGGLSGIGDLIVTCTSMHSRNRRAGILIGQGVPPEKAVEQVGTVEGYRTAPAAYELGKAAGVEMPITNEVYSVLFEGKDCRSTMIDLMTRRKTHETELLWM